MRKVTVLSTVTIAPSPHPPSPIAYAFADALMLIIPANNNADANDNSLVHSTGRFPRETLLPRSSYKRRTTRLTGGICLGRVSCRRQTKQRAEKGGGRPNVDVQDHTSHPLHLGAVAVLDAWNIFRLPEGAVLFRKEVVNHI